MAYAHALSSERLLSLKFKEDAVGELTALLGIDWGTHSSKWLWKVVEDDGSAREGRFKILRSDVRLENDALAIFVDAPPTGSVFKASLKRHVIQYPDGPFWDGRLRNIAMSLGELVSYSLWDLVIEAYQDFVEQVATIPKRIEIRFSLPNWVDGPQSAEARARYEQAAWVACSLLKFENQREPLSVPRGEWHDSVARSLTTLKISDETPVDYAEDGFRRSLEKTFRVDDDRLSFKFVAESSAAGLAGLRKTTELPPGYLHKILVVDVGAGSADIGYVIRSVNDQGKEGLSQLPPASTCQTAGDDLTKRIVDVFREKGRSISFDEAEAAKIGGRIDEWVTHPTVADWIESIAGHVSEYVRNIPDENWLPAVTPPLDVLVTGGSGAVPGLRDALTCSVESALRSRFGRGSTRAISLELPSPYDREANRLAVAMGAASEELPLLAYFRRLDRRIERPTVTMPRRFT
jgi:hypothetical protein